MVREVCGYPYNGYFVVGVRTFWCEMFLKGMATGLREIDASPRAFVAMVRRVLEWRSVDLTPDEKFRVHTCTDKDTLRRWLNRAFTAESAQDVFAEPVGEAEEPDNIRMPRPGSLIFSAFHSGMQRGFAEPAFEEHIAAVLRVLELRGVGLSLDELDRVRFCDDLDTLGRWFDRAVFASCPRELFDEPTPVG